MEICDDDINDDQRKDIMWKIKCYVLMWCEEFIYQSKNRMLVCSTKWLLIYLEKAKKKCAEKKWKPSHNSWIYRSRVKIISWNYVVNGDALLLKMGNKKYVCNTNWFLLLFSRHPFSWNLTFMFEDLVQFS